MTKMKILKQHRNIIYPRIDCLGFTTSTTIPKGSTLKSLVEKPDSLFIRDEDIVCSMRRRIAALRRARSSVPG